MTEFEPVKCKCPPYKGSDFWNDPHRWCGVDAPSQAFWMKSEPADCERTVRPVRVPVPIGSRYYAEYQNAYSLGGLYQQQMAYAQQSPFSSMMGTALGLFGL